MVQKEVQCFHVLELEDVSIATTNVEEHMIVDLRVTSIPLARWRRWHQVILTEVVQVDSLSLVRNVPVYDVVYVCVWVVLSRYSVGCISSC